MGNDNESGTLVLTRHHVFIWGGVVYGEEVWEGGLFYSGYVGRGGKNEGGSVGENNDFYTGKKGSVDLFFLLSGHPNTPKLEPSAHDRHWQLAKEKR